ncbi:MAG: carbon-nitrogen hydrolase family protein [Planctomycetes bacterium]|nr:carbon-nitrogen hydrolase family protein [Planctomycetota bacterium]
MALSLLILVFVFSIAADNSATGDDTAIQKSPDGWTTFALREEVSPKFHYDSKQGRTGSGTLVISAAGREGIDGAWRKSFPVKGGRYYRFSVFRITKNVKVPRRSVVVSLTWQDDKGRLVQGKDDLARPEFPRDSKINSDGWTEVTDTYLAPEKATQAVIELHLRWTKHGSVRWSHVSLKEVDKPKGRKVRLATVHFRPRGGKTAADNCKQFAKYIAEAASQKADLVCLPESLTLYGTGLKYKDVAEPIPGPSTKYFGELASKHNLYIVAGLMERSGHLIYNTAVLMGPEGNIVGKYRKVCLPREEIEGGVAPGHQYPVFETRFGKVGMMICWDVHFPEVARNLSNNGAEVIAMPIWGGNPALARARSIENQIYLVSSTYTDPNRDWMKSGIWDYEGNLLATGTEWGKVLIVEVDLDRRKHWRFLGDFKARIARERPGVGFRE